MNSSKALQNSYLYNQRPPGLAGPNIDLLCIWQLDTAPFCENKAKPYFDAKHLEKGLNRGWLNFWYCFFFLKKFDQYLTLP